MPPNAHKMHLTVSTSPLGTPQVTWRKRTMSGAQAISCRDIYREAMPDCLIQLKQMSWLSYHKNRLIHPSSTAATRFIASRSTSKLMSWIAHFCSVCMNFCNEMRHRKADSPKSNRSNGCEYDSKIVPSFRTM